jgi:hypothetical protein
MTESYQKHIYEINVEYCSKTIIERIQNEVKDAVKQSHFISLFEFTTNEFLKSRNLPEGLSAIRQEQHSIIKTDHDDFYMWLAYFLTTQNPKTIPLILEAYKEQRFGPTVNFGNTIEFLVYGLMSHVPFEHNDQDRAVMKWIMGSNYAANPLIGPDDFCQDEKKISNIIIKEEWQNRLKTIFSPYLDSKEDRPKFIKAMEGRHLIPGNEVTLNLKANVFCDVIRKIHAKGYLISSRKNKISEWICTNFQFDKKGEIAKIKATYCIQLLSGRESPNQKDTLVIDFSDRQSTVYQ